MTFRIVQAPKLPLLPGHEGPQIDYWAQTHSTTKYALSGIRELYNTRYDGNTVMNRDAAGAPQLITFLHEAVGKDVTEMEQRIIAGGIGDFVRWATTELERWILEDDSPVAIGRRCRQIWNAFLGEVVAEFKTTAARESLVMTWRNTVEMENTRLAHLSVLLFTCFRRLEQHHGGRPPWSQNMTSRRLGWEEVETIIIEADWIMDPEHDKLWDQFRWSGHSTGMGSAQRIAYIAPKIMEVLLSTQSCLRIEYALQIILPIMPKLADWAWVKIQRGLWVETLRVNGMGWLADEFEQAMDARHQNRIDTMGFVMRGIVGPMELDY